MKVKNEECLTSGHEAIERWKQHFDEHLNGIKNVRHRRKSDYVSAAGYRNELNSKLNEVRNVIHQLKHNKAAGKEGTAHELNLIGRKSWSSACTGSLSEI